MDRQAYPTKSLLVLDKDVVHCESTAWAVASDFNVTCVTDPRLALKIITSRKPNVLLLEYEISEIAVADIVRAVRVRSPFTAILLTSAVPDLRQAAHRLDLRMFIPKPLDYEQLTKLLNELVPYEIHQEGSA